MSAAYRVVFVGDPPIGHLEFVSDTCAALIGAVPDEIVDHPGRWTAAIHPDDRDEFVQTTAELIAHGGFVTRSYRLHHPGTDTYRMVEDHLTATTADDGRLIGYEAVVTLAS